MQQICLFKQIKDVNDKDSLEAYISTTYAIHRPVVSQNLTFRRIHSGRQNRLTTSWWNGADRPNLSITTHSEIVICALSNIIHRKYACHHKVLKAQYSWNKFITRNIISPCSWSLWFRVYLARTTHDRGVEVWGSSKRHDPQFHCAELPCTDLYKTLLKWFQSLK